jgi:hypothetical protein
MQPEKCIVAQPSNTFSFSLPYLEQQATSQKTDKKETKSQNSDGKKVREGVEVVFLKSNLDRAVTDQQLHPRKDRMQNIDEIGTYFR